MGWSCTAEVSATLDRLCAACAKQTGQANVFEIRFEERTLRYLFEVLPKEYPSGMARCEVARFVDKTHVQRDFDFTIRPDGTLLFARGRLDTSLAAVWLLQHANP